MTDREKLLALMESFGIEPQPTAGIYAGLPNATVPESERNGLVLMAKRGNVGGYSGFFCYFDFDEAGAFTGAGVEE